MNLIDLLLYLTSEGSDFHRLGNPTQQENIYLERLGGIGVNKNSLLTNGLDMRDNSSTNGDTQHLSWTVRTLSQSTVAVFHCINKGR
ncbi:hypothetical protein AT4G24413 [Arabidopsis thaliana]|uniref:Uncharacterized protein n=1 Tax=Arabidopsis thaliana TaxID=3702 RepID=A0A1P8B5M9_ARATH|nr:uncharacterized protein AT4G24413 [Arabidopsis thaliana]ANM66888.1 hypothetical protein AT4G24413 [Arabidopsis thaliana]|eukprot:NP_001328756.1 hypothetical protein AT4G24413 [Arabidopsis thaliana]